MDLLPYLRYVLMQTLVHCPFSDPVQNCFSDINQSINIRREEVDQGI
jgi:hypothetical protein